MAILPIPPLQDGYSVKESAPVARVFRVRGGRPRGRADLDQADLDVSCSWALSAGLYDQFMAFYRHSTARGSAPFTLDLLLDDYVLKSATARFVPDSLRLSRVDGGTYRVSADLQVEEPAFDAEADEAFVTAFERLGGEHGALAVVSRLAHLVNVDMPNSIGGD